MPSNQWRKEQWRANADEADKSVPALKQAKVAAVNWSQKEHPITLGETQLAEH